MGSEPFIIMNHWRELWPVTQQLPLSSLAVEYRLAPDISPGSVRRRLGGDLLGGQRTHRTQDGHNPARSGRRRRGRWRPPRSPWPPRYGGPPIFAQVLVAQVDRDMGTPSIGRWRTTPMLTLDDISTCDLADGGPATRPVLSGACVCHRSDRLPPAIVLTAECDRSGTGVSDMPPDCGTHVQTTVTRRRDLSRVPDAFGGHGARSFKQSRRPVRYLRRPSSRIHDFRRPITGQRRGSVARTATHNQRKYVCRRRIRCSPRNAGCSFPTYCGPRPRADRQRLHRGSAPPPARRRARQRAVESDHRPALRVGDELVATMSRMFPEGLTLAGPVLTPTFRGCLAFYGAVLYPELHDCFCAQFLEQAKSYWARSTPTRDDALQHQRPVRQSGSGPSGLSFPRCAARERTHLVDQRDGQIGLFSDYLIKMAQVIVVLAGHR